MSLSSLSSLLPGCDRKYIDAGKDFKNGGRGKKKPSFSIIEDISIRRPWQHGGELQHLILRLGLHVADLWGPLKEHVDYAHFSREKAHRFLSDDPRGS